MLKIVVLNGCAAKGMIEVCLVCDAKQIAGNLYLACLSSIFNKNKKTSYQLAFLSVIVCPTQLTKYG